MKLITTITLALSICLLSSCSTVKRVPASESDLALERFINVPGINQDKLFTIINEWMVITFVDAEAVVQYTDKESGKIIGKHVGSYARDFGGTNNYKSIISIDVKDDKARIQFIKPMYYSRSKDFAGYYPVKYKGTIDRIRKDWMALAEDLGKYVKEWEEW